MDSLKVLLIEPGESFAEEGCSVLGKQTPSLGLVSIATYLRVKAPRIIVSLFDQQISRKNLLSSLLRDFSPHLVGIQSYSYNLPAAYRVAQEVKSFLPEARVLLGGPHGTALPKETLEGCPQLDGVVLGEGEESVLEYCLSLLEDEEKKEIEGICFRGNSDIIKYRNWISQLDSLPLVDWNLVRYADYRKVYSFNSHRMDWIYPISTSRGCPFHCQFCQNSFLGSQIRMRSAGSVLEELRCGQDQGRQFFYFVDPNFLWDRTRVEEICEGIRGEIFRERRGRISWKCQSRVCFSNRNLFKQMKLAGCELIFFGIESGDDRVLALNKPNQNRKMIQQAVADARWAGLKVRASFLLGLPGETRESMEETLRFAEELKLDGYGFHTLDIYPGTPLWERFSGECSGEFSRGQAQISGEGLSPEEITSVWKRAKERGRVGEWFVDEFIRKDLAELRYYLDHDRRIFHRIASDYLAELEGLCQKFQS